MDTKLTPPPPTKVRFAMNRFDDPKCGICSKLLGSGQVKGRDLHLGYVCHDCHPHLCRAIEVLAFVQYHMPS